MRIEKDRHGRLKCFIPLPCGAEAVIGVYESTTADPVFEVYEQCGKQGHMLRLEDIEALANALLRLARELKYPQGITVLQGVSP